jgi:nucleoside-diphosphate-sugar epimerase
MTVNSAHRGLRAIVVRPFNVAGPGQSRAGGFVLPTFVQQALAGEPLTVFSTGEQVRAFLAVDDLVRFLVDFMDAALEKRDAIIYNLGNPANAITVRRLAELVRSLAGSTSDIIYVDGRAIHGPLYAEAESTEKVPVLRGAADLGWRPFIGLKELILQTIDYYRKQVDRQGTYASHQRYTASPCGSPARR